MLSRLWRDLVQQPVIRNCRVEGLLELAHLANFQVKRQASAQNRQLRIPADVGTKCKKTYEQTDTILTKLK